MSLPQEPVDRILGPLQRFLRVEAASGILLLAATVVALGLANSPWIAVRAGVARLPEGVGWGAVAAVSAGAGMLALGLRRSAETP